MERVKALALAIVGAAAPVSGHAADRAIAVPPTVKSSWAFETHTTTAKLRPHQAVGFWQRSSGAKAGVGANFVSVMEYQLPEAAPARVRSASFQFSGRPAHLQCAGTEPVVIDVFAYAADGRADVNDARSGSRVAQLSADCSDKAAFVRPIDVTAIVRQQAVPSGVRFVGFNIRKANNRQGAGLFDLSAGKLTVVLADQAVAQAPMAKVPAAVAPGAAVAGKAVAPTQAMVRPTPSQVPARPATPPHTYGMSAPERAMAAQARAAAQAAAGKSAPDAATQR